MSSESFSTFRLSLRWLDSAAMVSSFRQERRFDNGSTVVGTVVTYPKSFPRRDADRVKRGLGHG